MSQQVLISEILSISNSDKWEVAKTEWSLFEVYDQEIPSTCLCDHFPIKEICVIRNDANGNKAVVGNCCVKRFLDIQSDKIFSSIKRVRKDYCKSLNLDSVQYAFNKKWISTWERDFYLDIKSKRKLSSKQLKKKQEINATISNMLRK